MPFIVINDQDWQLWNRQFSINPKISCLKAKLSNFQNWLNTLKFSHKTLIFIRNIFITLFCIYSTSVHNTFWSCQWGLVTSVDGDIPSPLRTANYFIIRLRTAYGLILGLRTAYLLTTKLTIFGVSIFLDKIQSVTCAGTIIFVNFMLCLLDIFNFSLINDDKTSNMTANEASARKKKDFFTYCVSWSKLYLFKVEFVVCVRYNRIFAYCLPT